MSLNIHTYIHLLWEISQELRAGARKSTQSLKAEWWGKAKRIHTNPGAGERQKNLNMKQAYENIILFADKGTVGFRCAVR